MNISAHHRLGTGQQNLHFSNQYKRSVIIGSHPFSVHGSDPFLNLDEDKKGSGTDSGKHQDRRHGKMLRLREETQ